MSKDFEDGVRFALERVERYTEANGPSITQFGRYQMSMEEKELLPTSTKHLERRISAIVACANNVQR